MTPDRVVNPAAKARRPAKPSQLRTPQVVDLLRKAQEWRRQLDAGEVPTQAEIARREGITWARVTQVIGMFRFAPEIQGSILALPLSTHRRTITEQALQPIAYMGETTAQNLMFQRLVESAS